RPDGRAPPRPLRLPDHRNLRAAAATRPDRPRSARLALLVGAGLAPFRRAAVPVEAVAAAVQLALRDFPVRRVPPLPPRRGPAAPGHDRPLADVPPRPEPDARRPGSGLGPLGPGALLAGLRPSLTGPRRPGWVGRRPGHADQVHRLPRPRGDAALGGISS